MVASYLELYEEGEVEHINGHTSHPLGITHVGGANQKSKALSAHAQFIHKGWGTYYVSFKISCS